MTKPDQITLNVNYDENGHLDDSAILIQLEALLPGRIKITDWVSERSIQSEYEHLSIDQVHELIHNIDIGDYDDAIDKDLRRDALNEACSRADLPVLADGDLADDDDSEHYPAP